MDLLWRLLEILTPWHLGVLEGFFHGGGGSDAEVKHALRRLEA